MKVSTQFKAEDKENLVSTTGGKLLNMYMCTKTARMEPPAHRTGGVGF